MKRTAAALGLLLACVAPVRSQAGDPGKRLLADPAVRKALDWVKHNEPSILEEQVRLCEIPAPPFKERERGEAYRQLFEKLGLKDVRIDAAGNVLGERPGRAAQRSRKKTATAAIAPSTEPASSDTPTSRVADPATSGSKRFVINRWTDGA